MTYNVFGGTLNPSKGLHRCLLKLHSQQQFVPPHYQAKIILY